MDDASDVGKKEKGRGNSLSLERNRRIDLACSLLAFLPVGMTETCVIQAIGRIMQERMRMSQIWGESG